MLSQDITCLLLELLQLVSILSYRFVLWAFRCGLTADSRLHIARVCGRGSLVKLRGLTRIRLLWSAHLCWLDATRAAGRGHGNWERHCGAGLVTQEVQLPSSTRHCRRLNREDVEWAKYRSNNACVGVLEGMAAPCRRLAIYQGFSNDDPWDNYRRSALFVCSVCTGEQHAHIEMCIGARYRTISGWHDIARSMNPWSISRYRIISMNPKTNPNPKPTLIPERCGKKL